MSDFKRGDHVFNNGLKQSLKDISALVKEVLRADPKQRNPTGASERASRLNQIIAALDRGLSHKAFDLVGDKPSRTPGGDSNSRQFGGAKQQFVYAFRQMLEALKRWEAAKTPADAQAESRHLHTACLGLRLAVVKWADTAVDREAIQTLDAGKKSLAADGQKYLAQLRDDFINLLKYYQP